MEEKSFKNGIILYFLLAFALILCYGVFSPFIKFAVSSESSGLMPYIAFAGDTTTRIIMLVSIAVIFGIAAIDRIINKLEVRHLIAAVIVAGMVMRVGYMLYTPFYIHGHDIGTLTGTGHYAYIAYIYTHFSLPDTNTGEFYHPPLAYIIYAAVAHVYAFFTQSTDMDTIVESVKLVPCFASCALLLICLRIFDELPIHGSAKVLAIAIIAFQPTFYILSASINNDMLMILFFMIAFLYTLRWYKNPTYKNILILAVSIACAMLTKISGVLIAFVTAAAFIAVFIRSIKTPFFRRLMGQFAAFAAVCVPLGLSYSIRNYILFGQTLGYVLDLGKDTTLYIGNHSLFSRFFTLPLKDLFLQRYCNIPGDFQIWLYTIRSSLFGEFSFSHDRLALIFLLANTLLIGLSLVAMIYVFLHKGKNHFNVILLLVMWLIVMIFYLHFNINYPVICTMDFRYIVPTAIAGAAFIGIFAEKCKTNVTFISKIAYHICIGFVTIFSALSILFYTL